MSSDLQVCPGTSLESFIRAIAYDLKRRRIEYFIIAYFDLKGFPMAMREISGRTSWVSYSTNEIIDGAKQLEASGVCLVHNHPVSAGESPSLQPSTQDIRSQLGFLSACGDNGLTYLGSWIVSKGLISEVLYSARELARRLPSSEIEFDSSELSRGITSEFAASVDALTKPAVIRSDWYKIGDVKVEYGALITVQARVFYAIASQSSQLPDVLITVKDPDGREHSGLLSVEEASRACQGLSDLYSESLRMSERRVEYSELTLSLGEQCRIGVYQVGSDQKGYAKVSAESCFLNMKVFPDLQRLFEGALEKLEFVVK